MNRRILIQVTTPAVVIGMLLVGACLISAWQVNQLQLNQADIQNSNIASIRAAAQVEICARDLRFHCYLELIDADDVLQRKVERDRKRFEDWLARAEEVAFTPREQVCIVAIKEGYGHFSGEFDRMREETVRTGPRRDFRALADANRIGNFVDPCREYWRVNEELMKQTSDANDAISRRLRWTMLLLGVAGPLGGVLGGYGIARSLSRSLFRLSLRIRDVAQELEQDVTSVNLAADGNLFHLDQQLRQVLHRVAEVVKRLQDQQREMLRAHQLAAVGQLAASVAHEIRNPLTSIKLLVEAGLRTGKPKPFTAENLTVVHGEIFRLEQTVQGFLDFARPPALTYQACDIRAVVARAIELVRARADQQKVQIDLGASGGAVTGTIDPGQLGTVFVNLFINALDAMPAGGRLAICMKRESPTRVCLEVSDTGGGIRPEMFDQLFAPFTSTKATGSGLGLSVSKRIVEEHGGAITAANGVDGGARFTVSLPITKGEESHAGIAGH